MIKSKMIVVIAGPTAVGKTGIAIEAAKKLGTSIISADSRQCYQGMKTGTVQPTEEELAAVPHYFINNFPVTTPLNAADYEQLALGYIDTVFQENDIAIVCGGTGLYIKALCEGLDEMPAANEDIARQTQQAYEEHGLSWLQAQLQHHDPEIYTNIDTQNPARLLRALIFKLSTGHSLRQYQLRAPKERPFRILKVGLELPRPQLYDRINQRVDMMMNDGFLAEAKALFPHRDLKNLQTVGYTELFDHLAGITTLQEAVALIKQHTRNYAKRQMTWFRRDEEMNWLTANENAAAAIVSLAKMNMKQ